MADDGVLNKAQQKIRNDRIKAAAMKVKRIVSVWLKEMPKLNLPT